mgnify:FL=1|jgi:hypothetical protein
MNICTIRKLEKLGFDKDWLMVVKSEWKPKKRGAYDMLITDIQNLSDDPLYGTRIERTKFNNDYDLSLILKYFEGNAYVIVEVDSNEIISKGILDDSVFDIMHYWTQENWDIYSNKELESERQMQAARNESIINRLTRENYELQVENAKLRLQLKEKQK